MEYLYNAYTKSIDSKLHYFVKKTMTFPEFPGAAAVQVGYGMHTDFEKACNICGVDDRSCRKQLLFKLEQSNLLCTEDWLPLMQTNRSHKTGEKNIVQIPGKTNRWLVERGVESLN